MTTSGARCGGTFVAVAAPLSTNTSEPAIGQARGNRVRPRGLGRTGSCTLTTKATRATDEDGRLVFKEELSRGLVLGLDEGRDGSSLALVQDFEQPMPGMVSGAWRPGQSS